MPLNDPEGLNTLMQGTWGAHHDAASNDIKAMVNQSFRRTITLQKAADANAASVTATEYQFRSATNIKLISVHWLTNAAATASNTTFATLLVQVGDGLGAAVANVATVNTQIVGGGNIASGVPYAIAITAGSETVDAGEVIGFQVTKTSTGVAITKGVFVLHYEEI